ncbi:DNA alkylation repair protein [Pseudopelagicola sp. nBUS_19]|uniref:DNA alkylation repair protein n=1 Tax=Pseudopelagicola sp. nBUS_19 TaxID=3395316 RepID=UPI003EBCB52A
MVNLEQALDELRANIEPDRASQMATTYKQSRLVLGLSASTLNNLSKSWRQSLSTQERVELAKALWETDIFEARITAAKLLTQARLRPDAAAWELIQDWVPQLDSLAIADHACVAGQKRLAADRSRINIVQGWVTSDHIWQRRAALIITLPWAKLNFPKPKDLEIREQVLGWAAIYVNDKEWIIQKSIAQWLKNLSKHDANRTQEFLKIYGSRMKGFAQKEASTHLSDFE